MEDAQVQRSPGGTATLMLYGEPLTLPVEARDQIVRYIEGLRDQVQDLDGKCQRFTAERTAWSKTMTDGQERAQVALAEIAKCAAKIQQLEDDVVSRDRTIADLQDGQSGARVFSDRYKQELAAKGAEVQMIRQEATSVRAQLDHAEEELRGLGADNDKLYQDLSREQDARANLEDAYRRLEARYQRLEKEKKGLENELEDVRVEMHVAQDRNQRLGHEMSELRAGLSPTNGPAHARVPSREDASGATGRQVSSGVLRIPAGTDVTSGDTGPGPLRTYNRATSERLVKGLQKFKGRT
jgi:chromosome segregation ATPase